MLLTFILSAVAGFATRPLESQINDMILSKLPAGVLDDPADRRVAGLMLLLLVAAIVLALSGLGGTLVFTIGALLGYFHKQILDFYKKKIAEDDAVEEVVEDATSEAKDS